METVADARQETLWKEKCAEATMEAEDNRSFMRRLEDESMKLIVTSPPYNIGKAYESRRPLERYVEEQARVISECVRLLHPHGSICWQVGNHVRNGEILPLDLVLYQVFRDEGLKLRNRIIWHFEHGLHCKKRLSGRYETILWFTKGDDYTFNLDPDPRALEVPQQEILQGTKGRTALRQSFGQESG